jgi:hypothetical protein
MMSKPSGGLMMLGVALLGGCSQGPRDTVGDRLSEVMGRNDLTAQVASPNQDRLPDRRATPYAVPQDRVATAQCTPAQHETLMPEACNVRVTGNHTNIAQAPQQPSPLDPAWQARQGPPAALPDAAVQEPPQPTSPSPVMPEVVVGEVSAAPASGVSQASWSVTIVKEGKEEDPPRPPQVSKQDVPAEAPPPAAEQSVQTAEFKPQSSTDQVMQTSANESRPAADHGHAEDYSWLTGELEYIHGRNLWRLRYAPPHEEDKYGGTVVLVGDDLPADRKSGQIVRVEGQLANPESSEAHPPYWVRSMQVLKPAPFTDE